MGPKIKSMMRVDCSMCSGSSAVSSFRTTEADVIIITWLESHGSCVIVSKTIFLRATLTVRKMGGIWADI